MLIQKKYLQKVILIPTEFLQLRELGMAYSPFLEAIPLQEYLKMR